MTDWKGFSKLLSGKGVRLSATNIYICFTYFALNLRLQMCYTFEINEARNAERIIHEELLSKCVYCILFFITVRLSGILYFCVPGCEIKVTTFECNKGEYNNEILVF